MILEQIFEFAYTQSIIFNDINNAVLVLEGSDFLQFDRLKDICFQFLASCIDINNVLGIRCFAKMYSGKDLVDEADQFLYGHTADIITKGDEFMNLPKEEVLEILPLLNVASENTIWHAVNRWIQFDSNQRKQDFSQLLSKVSIHTETILLGFKRSNKS